MKILLLFLDGVGLGDADADVNPFVTASLPTLHGLLGTAPLTRDSVPLHAADASLVAVDALLGIEGVPQSGTGQASLLTGINAAALYGRHFGPWVPARLRSRVRDESVLAHAVHAGHTVAFANAYPEEILSEIAVLHADDRGRTRRAPHFLRAGPPLAALGAGLLTRHAAELASGDAVASEITNEGWRERLGRVEVPIISAVEAGANLGRIVAQHELTLFAHYATDYAGHRGDMDAAIQALERVDAFLGGLLSVATDDTVIIITSDHGNIEDVRAGHTRNPAIGIAIGGGHALLARRIRSLTDVAPAILDLLSIAAPA